MSNAQKYFTNFKVHTQYSICEGAIKIPELADYCKTNKVPVIGLKKPASPSLRKIFAGLII